MGQLNKRALLTRLQRLGTASRADLAKSLGLSQPTTGKIVDQLLDRGIFVEVGTQQEMDSGNRGSGPARSRLGRPGRLLRLDRTRPKFLGIQLDVHETKLALLNIGADLDDKWLVAIPTPESAAEWVRGLRKAAGKLRLRQFLGTLVSVPGIVDERSRKVLFSPNLHWTENADLPALVQSVWDAPVALVQELHALALGYQTFNTSGEDFLAVDIGEGVGAAVVLGGKLYGNQLPISGELGHNPVAGNQRRCGCGAVGCLETLFSMRGLIQSLAEHHPGHSTRWNDFAAYTADHGVVPWLGETLDAAGVVIAGALNVLGIRRVVISGAMSDLPPTLHRYLSDAIARGALWQRFGHVTCEFTPRYRTAGLISVGIDRFVVPTEMEETFPKGIRPAIMHA
jgi:predicted NBD/HSP70 family sugar kinase